MQRPNDGKSSNAQQSHYPEAGGSPVCRLQLCHDHRGHRKSFSTFRLWDGLSHVGSRRPGGGELRARILSSAVAILRRSSVSSDNLWGWLRSSLNPLTSLSHMAEAASAGAFSGPRGHQMSALPPIPTESVRRNELTHWSVRSAMLKLVRSYQPNRISDDTADQQAGATGVSGEQRKIRRLVMLPSSRPSGSLTWGTAAMNPPNEGC
jgi:hypothetical protein